MAEDDQNQPKSRLSGLMIACDSDLQDSLLAAAEAYVKNGGSVTDGVYFTVIVSSQDGIIGAGPEAYVDLEDCCVSYLTFERDGSDPVEVKLEEDRDVEDILEDAGIELADDEKLFDSSGEEINLDGALSPDGDDATYIIRKAGDGAAEGGDHRDTSGH